MSTTETETPVTLTDAQLLATCDYDRFHALTRTIYGITQVSHGRKKKDNG